MPTIEFDIQDPVSCETALAHLKTAALACLSDPQAPWPADVDTATALYDALLKHGRVHLLSDYLEDLFLAARQHGMFLSELTYDGTMPVGIMAATRLARLDEAAIPLFERYLTRLSPEIEPKVILWFDSILAVHDVTAATMELVGCRMCEGQGRQGLTHIEQLSQLYDFAAWMHEHQRLERVVEELRDYHMAGDIATLQRAEFTRAEFTRLVDRGELQAHCDLNGLTVTRDWLVALFNHHPPTLDAAWVHCRADYLIKLWEACEPDLDPYAQPGLLAINEKPAAGASDWTRLDVSGIPDTCTTLGIGYEAGVRGRGTRIFLAMRQGEHEESLIAEAESDSEQTAVNGVFAAAAPFDNVELQVTVEYGGTAADQAFYAALIMMGIDADGEPVEFDTP